MQPEANQIKGWQEPLGTRHNKAWPDWFKRVAVWSGFERPVIRRGHSLRPGVSPDG